MRFKLGARIRIKASEGAREKVRPLNGREGTVVRLLMRSSDEAWVSMDDDLPANSRSFFPGDERARHICLFDDECTPAAQPSGDTGGAR